MYTYDWNPDDQDCQADERRVAQVVDARGFKLVRKIDMPAPNVPLTAERFCKQSHQQRSNINSKYTHPIIISIGPVQIIWKNPEAKSSRVQSALIIVVI